MVFNERMLVLISFVLVSLWLVTVTFYLYQMIRHYHRLTDKTGKSTVQEVLDALMESQKKTNKQVHSIQARVEELTEESVVPVQRIGLVRFNPFSDTGGSQSFTLALLDRQDNGITLTSLHARGGQRWYVKQVKKGKGVGLSLSKEEEAAIQLANRQATKQVS